MHCIETLPQIVLVLCISLGPVFSSVPGDLIHDLPGVTFELPYNMYSGYLNASDGKRLHYWFVESASDPSSDPVMLWMNGGPGCSSMEGFLEEHGPILLNDDGRTFRRNPFAWNSQASVLYLEAPAGVGFSYSNTQNYTTDDDQVAYDNYLALSDFFAKYPEYRQNSFFITGESYAGIYVPTLSVRVLADKAINFKGLAVGNGISDFTWNDNSLIYFGYYHGLISQDLWTQLMLSCCPATHRGPCDIVNNQNIYCQKTLLSVLDIVRADDINMYNLYAPCLNGGPSGRLANGNYLYRDIPYLFMNNRQVAQERQSVYKMAGDKLKAAIPCVNTTSMETYMNRAEVRRALHVPEQVQAFEVCSGVVSSRYKTIYKNVKQFYATVLNAKKRVLMYNGDVDMACNFLGDEWFVGTLGLQRTNARRQWKYTDPVTGTEQVAGFVDTYPDLTFTTIRGSGHMVPQDRPKVAYDMINKFLNNQEL